MPGPRVGCRVPCGPDAGSGGGVRCENPSSGAIPQKIDESLLATIAPFRRLAPAQIREIVDLARARRFADGAVVFEENAEATHFFPLLDGTIRVVRLTPTGERVTALHLASGQLFGIAPALGHSAYPATAIAAGDCLALSWPAARWSDFAGRYEGFASETYRAVGGRIGEMTDRIVEFATRQVEQRIAGALLLLARKAGRPVEPGVQIGFPVTREDIPEMTGTTLHTVSRTLAAWGCRNSSRAVAGGSW